MKLNSNVFLLFCFFLSVIAVQSQTHVWTGNGGNTNWFNAANWDVSTVPDNTSDALIGNGFEVRIADGIAEVRSIQLENNAQFVLENDLELSMDLNISNTSTFIFRSGRLHGGGTVENDGIIVLESATNREISNITVNNNGLFLVTNANQTFVTNNTVINNSMDGTIDIASVGGFLQQTSSATLNNAGLLKKSFDGVNPLGNFYLILEIFNSGIIEVPENEMLLFLAGNSDFINEAEGVIKGAGVFDITANFVNLGTISPGDENQAATMTVVNNFNLDPSGTLHLDILGTQPGEFDLVEVTGSPILAGNLFVNLPQGSVNIGDEFTVITSSNPFLDCSYPGEIIANAGDSNDYILEVVCNSNALILRVVDVLLSTQVLEHVVGGMKIFPNPLLDHAEVSLDPSLYLRHAEELELVVFNVLGTEVRRIRVNSERISLRRDGMSSGLYFIQLHSAGKTLLSGKLVIR